VDTPKTILRLCKFEFDVRLRVRSGANARHPAEHFMIRVLIGQQQRLPGGDMRGQTNHSTLRKKDQGVGLFEERFRLFGLAGNVRGPAWAVDSHGDFPTDRGTRLRRGTTGGDIKLCAWRRNFDRVLRGKAHRNC
jgi:hypothetical protein